MDNESAYLLQKIDCNCNECFFMKRDLAKYKKWEDWHRKTSFEDFSRRKEKAIREAENVIKNTEDERQKRSGVGMLRVANKMKFQFDKFGLIKYGDCLKFNKPITFLIDVCQLETQSCFSHRKDHKKS